MSFFSIKNTPRFFEVLSGSMEPAIHTGSVVVVIQESQYKIGDVVTFGKISKTEISTTHRIIANHAVEGIIFFSTKGDANNSPDIHEITKRDIQGKVLFSIPYIGYILDFARKPIGLLIIILIPSIFIIYDEIRKIVFEVKKIKRKKTAEYSNQKSDDIQTIKK